MAVKELRKQRFQASMFSLLYKNIGLKIKKSIAISHLKVNSLRKKMTEVKELITKKTDICLISETKHDQSFPNQQFQIHGYTMFQRERDKYRRVKPFYLNEHIPSKALHLYFTTGDNEVILLEFSIKVLKWLCIVVYKAPSQKDKYFIGNL